MAQKGETLVEVKDLCKNFGVTIAPMWILLSKPVKFAA